MNVVVYGTTGIVGYGVLHECLKATVGMQEDEYERITYSLTDNCQDIVDIKSCHDIVDNIAL